MEPGNAVHGILDAAARRFPQAPAVRDALGGWTYEELSRAGAAIAAWLGRRGVRAGDRIVTLLPAGREFTALVYAASRAGATLVPLAPTTTAYQVTPIVTETEARLLIAEDGADVPEFCAVADAGELFEAARPVGVSGGSETVHGTPSDPDTPRAPALIIYTSGTTSRPKGIVCPHDRVLFAARAIAGRLGYRRDDVVFCRLPLSFDYGLYQLFLCALAGAELVLAEDGSDVTVLRQLRRCGATVVPLVPSLASMLVTLARREHSPGGAGPVVPAEVRLFTNTGAELTPQAAHTLREAFPGAQVCPMYGISECKRVSILLPEEAAARPGSVGRPLPGTTVSVLGPDGTALPPRAVGEIVVDGPHVMDGYWRDPDRTARMFRPVPGTSRYRLHTGDHGYFDEEGYLYFSGRRDEIFKRRGVRMSTLEIEAAAESVAGVREAVVLVPHEERDLALFVTGTARPTVVLTELAARLGPARTPTRCTVLDALPLTANGKPDRQALRTLLDAGAPHVGSSSRPER
ncbi:class I adenylate-forming enzyme family protein [Streptomyces adelaidensis]|uniref:class I adenylate-forming enzyme family protein n=1 Tax=Streptomyces adelaidensis TaxID=2796465 RepID=UPI0027DE54D5|nr:AMP-binding protein [Streptomyces adelaidensis]